MKRKILMTGTITCIVSIVGISQLHASPQLRSHGGRDCSKACSHYDTNSTAYQKCLERCRSGKPIRI